MSPYSQQLKHLLAECQRAVIFTGAGISTESGIPDFRSPGGIWSKHQPVDFSDFIASAEARRASWRLKLMFDQDMQDAAPNRGHLAIARLFEQGIVSHVITQNVDGLHQQSGVPEDNVIELHGNATYAHCLDCGQRYDLAPIKKNFARDESLPVCKHCDGLVKAATISFGQAMPEQAMLEAEAATRDCDLFLAIGSSLQVYPAAGFPMIAKRNGAKLVIINRDPTDLDASADLLIHDEIGLTLDGVLP
ncbi:MAG: Sir2 family NAD-dependent protein deacetylase [Porticoccaceae bacterium]|nr:Sir2 family NAD-dependent protein deacetylase [Porticoccaceae bacterium]